MSVEISKVDALIEMVRAYDRNQIKKFNCIGKILSASIQEDRKHNVYNNYITLNKSDKKYFSKKIRKYSKN